MLHMHARTHAHTHAHTHTHTQVYTYSFLLAIPVLTNTKLIYVSTRKWFPLHSELAPLTKNVVLTRLLWKLEKVKEAKRRRLEATSTGTFTAQARKSSDS